MDINTRVHNRVHTRIRMLGGRVDDWEVFDYCMEKSLRQAKDFCNADEFPEEAETYLVEWAAADYLTETDGYSKQWERMRIDAEKGLVGFRRMRW